MQRWKSWKGSESDQGIIKEADISAEKQIVEANYSAVVKGAVLFNCLIDYENKVQESSEYNNRGTIVFKISETSQNTVN